MEVENETTGEVGAAARSCTSFGIGNVFDVSQTDGPPIAPPQPPEERFGTTAVARELDRRLATFLIGEGLRVETKPIPKVRGYLDPAKREVALNAELADDDGKTKTLAHETAHYLAGDTAGWEGRPLREFIAEAQRLRRAAGDGGGHQRLQSRLHQVVDAGAGDGQARHAARSPA